jgi:hypothetical protein
MAICDPCKAGDHDGCWMISSPHPDDRCDCLLADENDVISAPTHDIREGWRRASEGE